MNEFFKGINVEASVDGKIVVTVKVSENFRQQLVLKPDQMEKLISAYRKIKKG